MFLEQEASILKMLVSSEMSAFLQFCLKKYIHEATKLYFAIIFLLHLDLHHSSEVEKSGIPLVHIPSSRIFFYDSRPHDMKAKRTIAENQHCYQVKNPAG